MNCSIQVVNFIAVVVYVFLSLLPAHADAAININSDGDVFFSSNHKAKGVFRSHGAEVAVSLNRRKLYTIKICPPFSSPAKEPSILETRSARDFGFLAGNLFVSNDGATVVWQLAPQFFGHVMVSRRDGLQARHHESLLPPHAISNRQLLDYPALAIFIRGKLKKSYLLKDLLLRPEMVMQSTAHTIWLEPVLLAQQKFNPSRFLSADGKRLSFQTTSCRQYAVDAKTGEMLKASDTSLWKKHDLIIWGKFLALKNKRHFFCVKNVKVYKGKFSKPQLQFHDCTNSYPEKGNFWTGVALFKKGKCYEAKTPQPSFPLRLEPW